MTRGVFFKPFCGEYLVRLWTVLSLHHQTVNFLKQRGDVEGLRQIVVRAKHQQGNR